MIACNCCGSDNPPESHFCEDCGAQLQGESAVAVAVREGPLAPGEVLDERWVIEAVVESGRVNRYRVIAQTEEDSLPQLLLEAARRGDGSLLVAQSRLLDGVEHARLFRPDTRFEKTDFDYALGPFPGERHLEEHLAAYGPMSCEQVINLGHQVLSVLEALHEEGIISRSVQPNRIWLDDDLSVTLDPWDRATIKNGPVDEEANVTPGYSAPELYGIGELDERSDLFSLGAVLYTALTGERPELEARDTFFTLHRPTIEGADPVIDVIMKAVAKSPEARFSSAQEMKDALDRAAAGECMPAAPAPAPRPTPAPIPGGASPAPAAVVSRPTAEGPVVALKTDIGCVRSINQDACLELRLQSFEKSRPRHAHLVVVIDGMGGEAEGDKAASLALRSIAQEVVGMVTSLQNARVTSPLLPEDRVERNQHILRRALESANRTIHEYSELDPNRRGMGCTITATMLDGDLAVFAHVGDTRGYLVRDGLDQVTTDHSLVGRLVAAGTMTAEEARISPQRSIIYRAMGTNPEVEVDLYQRQLQPGDRLVLCSDGIWEYFTAGELESIVRTGADPHSICEELVRTCLARGADDNATVAVVQV